MASSGNPKLCVTLNRQNTFTIEVRAILAGTLLDRGKPPLATTLHFSHDALSTGFAEVS